MRISTILKPVGLALAAMAMAMPCFAQDYSLLQYEGADRNDKLIAAAKKEGSFTLYTSIAEKDVPPLVGPFEKKYGIKVKVWRAGSDKVLQRTLTEAQAKRHEVDLIHFSGPELEALHREKVLQPVKSPYFKDMVPGAVASHREWVSTLLTVWVQAYNTNQIKKEDLPKTYQDLTDPKWKGKLGVESEDFDWFAVLVTDMGVDKGVKLFKEITANNGMSVRKGHSLLTNMVGAGEVPMGLTVYNYMAEAAKKKGVPIDWFVLEPAVARTNGMGIARNAPRPAAAMLFYDYMLSPEAQKILAGMDYVPTNSTVESPMKTTKIKLVDPALTLDHIDKWSKLFDETMVKRR
jgi:iron(III) transport system substrate-binding protein